MSRSNDALRLTLSDLAVETFQAAPGLEYIGAVTEAVTCMPTGDRIKACPWCG
jgi:hypothetical protein